MSSDFKSSEKNNFCVYILSFFIYLIDFLYSIANDRRFIFATISIAMTLMNIIVNKTSYDKLKRYLIIPYSKWIQKKLAPKKENWLFNRPLMNYENTKSFWLTSFYDNYKKIKLLNSTGNLISPSYQHETHNKTASETQSDIFNKSNDLKNSSFIMNYIKKIMHFIVDDLLKNNHF